MDEYLIIRPKQIPHVERWWLQWLQHTVHMSPVSKTDSQPVNWLDNKCRLSLGEAKRIIGWANLIKHRSSRWMNKQTECCSGQSANNQPVFNQYYANEASQMQQKQPYENDAPGWMWVEVFECAFAVHVRVTVHMSSRKTVGIIGIVFQPQVPWIIPSHTIGNACRGRGGWMHSTKEW